MTNTKEQENPDKPKTVNEFIKNLDLPKIYLDYAQVIQEGRKKYGLSRAEMARRMAKDSSMGPWRTAAYLLFSDDMSSEEKAVLLFSGFASLAGASMEIREFSPLIAGLDEALNKFPALNRNYLLSMVKELQEIVQNEQFNSW